MHRLTAPILLVLLSCSPATAQSVSMLLGKRHEGHEEIDPSLLLSSVPLDSALKAHMTLQLITWGVLFPVGMVLGLTRSRWHVPMQVLATLLSVVGVKLAHHHGGRQFPHRLHGTFAKLLFYYMLIQVSLGVFLKLHIYEKTIRPVCARIHSLLGKLFVVLSWTQIVLGFITAQGFCQGGNVGQCLAHFIMGSAFQAYAIGILITLRFGASFLRRWGRQSSSESDDNSHISRDFLDSIGLMAWGIINTFTEHDFLETSSGWSHKDMQHVSLGVVWWAGGALGIFLSRGGRRTIVPALLIIITGLAMSSHEQPSMLSTKVHQLFGLCLCLGGIARAAEVTFLVRDETASSDSAFHHISPLLLLAAGLTFQSASHEQLDSAAAIGMDHVTYSLLVMSGSMVLYLYANLLLSLYKNSGRNAPPSDESHTGVHTAFSWKRMLDRLQPKEEQLFEVEALSPNGAATQPLYTLTDPERDSFDALDSVDLDEKNRLS